MVRTPGFHPGNRSSILRGAIKRTIVYSTMVLFDMQKRQVGIVVFATMQLVSHNETKVEGMSLISTSYIPERHGH